MTGAAHSSKILLTAFCDSSAELLIKHSKRYDAILLPNDKIEDSKKLIRVILDTKPDYVISFGQKPNLKDKVHIEKGARDCNSLIHTNFDCDELKRLFEQNGVASKVSHNVGTSFCNQLYLNVLMYLSQNKIDTKMVFIHIPFEKNISDVHSFFTRIYKTIFDFEEEQSQ